MIKSISQVINEVQKLFSPATAVAIVVSPIERIEWVRKDFKVFAKGVGFQTRITFNGPELLKIVKYAKENNFYLEVTGGNFEIYPYMQFRDFKKAIIHMKDWQKEHYLCNQATTITEGKYVDAGHEDEVTCKNCLRVIRKIEQELQIKLLRGNGE